MNLRLQRQDMIKTIDTKHFMYRKTSDLVIDNL